MSQSPRSEKGIIESPGSGKRVSSKKEGNTRSHRKPDQAVYVPRAKRMEDSGRRKVAHRNSAVYRYESEEMAHERSPPTEEGSQESGTPSPHDTLERLVKGGQSAKDRFHRFSVDPPSPMETTNQSWATDNPRHSAEPSVSESPPLSAPPIGVWANSDSMVCTEPGRRKSADDYWLREGTNGDKVKGQKRGNTVGSRFEESSIEDWNSRAARAAATKPPRNPAYPPGYVATKGYYNKPPPPQPQPNKRPLDVIAEMMRKSGMDESPPESPSQSAPSVSVVSQSASSSAQFSGDSVEMKSVGRSESSSRNSGRSDRTPTSGSTTSTEMDAGGIRVDGFKPAEKSQHSHSAAISVPLVRSEDAEILDALPTSYDDFESKDLHLKLEKRLSSPLVSPIAKQDYKSHFSPNDTQWESGFGSEKGPETIEGGTVFGGLMGFGGSPPPDPEDLEVQMINESFEELQKRQRMYESKQLKDLFYSFPNEGAGANQQASSSHVVDPSTNQRVTWAHAGGKGTNEQQPLWRRGQPGPMPTQGAAIEQVAAVWTKVDVKLVQGEAMGVEGAQKQGSIITGVPNAMTPRDKAPYAHRQMTSMHQESVSRDFSHSQLASFINNPAGQSIAPPKVTWAGWGSRPGGKDAAAHKGAIGGHGAWGESCPPGGSSPSTDGTQRSTGNLHGKKVSSAKSAPGSVKNSPEARRNDARCAKMTPNTTWPLVSTADEADKAAGRRGPAYSTGDMDTAPGGAGIQDRKTVSVDAAHVGSSEAAMDQLSIEMAEKVLSDLDDELLSPFSPKAGQSHSIGVQESVEENILNICGERGEIGRTQLESETRESENLTEEVGTEAAERVDREMEEEESSKANESGDVNIENGAKNPVKLGADADPSSSKSKETEKPTSLTQGKTLSESLLDTVNVVAGGSNVVENTGDKEIAQLLSGKLLNEEESAQEEDTWEDLCDEDGSTVDPKLIQEINLALGKVKIETTKFDYYGYRPKDVELDDNEFSHVLEVYGFPSEYKPSDLREALSGLPPDQYEVTWVDSTHALVSFTNTLAAKDALSMSHPGVELRPLSQASNQSKQKAQNTPEFLRPKKPRPTTNAAAARRMVELHLGKRSGASAEKRKQERVALAQAKEHKVTSIRNKESAWEGNL